MGNKDTERRKSNMEILIASEQPYTYLSQMKERIQFVGALSLGELYQLQEILPYLMIKEHIGKEEAAWDTKMYLEVVEEWMRREEALISEEEKQSLTEALIKMLPENGQSYVIDGKESRVDSLQRYGEFCRHRCLFQWKHAWKKSETAEQTTKKSLLKMKKHCRTTCPKSRKQKAPAGLGIHTMRIFLRL